MTAMTGKERALLRADCNALKATVHVGAQGLSGSLFRSLDDTLRTHELVKVQIGKPVEGSARDLANQLAAKVGAEVIQVIGKTCTVYRHNPDIERKYGDLPPWKR